MAVGALVSAVLTWYLRRVARETGSVALAADSTHYASDVWMNLGVFAALAVAAWTKEPRVDPVVGLLVAAIVLRSSWTVIRASLDELMDKDLGPDVEESIRRAVKTSVPQAGEVREVRTRRAGAARFVDLTVAIDRSLAFVDAHRLSERVRSAVLEAVPRAVVTVHADPDPLLPGDHP
jgi:ferrous-iron efflux pump FieF